MKCSFTVAKYQSVTNGWTDYKYEVRDPNAVNSRDMMLDATAYMYPQEAETEAVEQRHQVSNKPLLNRHILAKNC